jgi:cytoskeletal protein CcmA (bactofilin family)/nicotinamidase-related amidase
MSGAPPPFKSKDELKNEIQRTSNNNTLKSLVNNNIDEDFDNKFPSTKSPFELLDENIEMLVGENVILKGDLNIEKLIRVDGILEGHITAPRQAGIIIGENGSVIGNIFNFTACYIHGKVIGDIIADSIVLVGNASIHGNIKCMSLETTPTVLIVGDLNINPLESPCKIESDLNESISINNNIENNNNNNINNNIINNNEEINISDNQKESEHRNTRRDSMTKKDEKKKQKKSTLLVIDPQVDFHFGGTCAVQGADQDSEKIAELIKDNIDKIDEIFVTLDSHHRLHIAHSYFWINNAGESPPPYTEITLEHMDNKTWFPRNEVAHEKCYDYLKALESGKEGRKQLLIKPEHCLIGTEGHSVVSCINDALQDWAKQRLRKVNYFLKGMNCYTDMNSAFVADVEIAEDPSTFLDPNMLKKLFSRDKLILCGSKMSSCFNFTTRDIINNWNGDLTKLVVVRDGEYNKQTITMKTMNDTFWEFLDDKKINICRSTEVFLNNH